MAYRKEVRAVNQYVQKLEKTVRSDQEKCLQGLNIAKMYYEAGEMEKCLKHVNKYISVQDRDYRALKLLGQIYSTTGHHINAINYYKRSLELRGDQHDVIMRVGQLYCTMKEGVRPVDIKEWLGRVKNIDPTHPIVFKLKERLLPSSSSSVTDEHFNALQAITREQLTLGIDDEVLHVKLATLYVKSGSLVDAVCYCQSVNESSVMFGNFKWQLFCLDLYQHYCDSRDNQDVKVHISMLQSMDILLNHMMETKESQSTTVDLLIKFDMLLQRVIESEVVGSEIAQLVDELCGTLYCHCGKYLLSHHDELSLGLACVIAALSVMVPNIHHSTSHDVHYWKQATYRRISQCGHIIKYIENNYGYNFLTSVSKVTTAMVVNAIYTGKKWDPGKSVIVNENKFVNLRLHTPSDEELQFCDCEVIGNNPFNLSFLLWVTMCKGEMGSSFLVLCVQQLFPCMKTNTNKLSSRCDVDTLCHFDMEAFLVLLLDKLRSDVRIGADGMMVTSFLGGLPVEVRYSKFWKNALKLSNKKINISVKEEMQKVIAEVRGFKPVQLSIKQLGTLAQHFKKRAEDILEYDDSENVRRLVEALFVNSCHYWKLVIESVRGKSNCPFRHTSQRSKMSNSGTGMTLYSKLIDRSDHLSSPSDHDSLLDEAFISLGTAALYCKDTNTALLNYGHVKSPQGPYQQCKVYLMMSEKCRVDDAHKSYGLLEKANSCIEQAMQRIDDSGLIEKLQSMQLNILLRMAMQLNILLRMDTFKGVNDSKFYDDFISVHRCDSEAPLVHSAPPTVNQVALLNSLKYSNDASLSKVNIIPTISSDASSSSSTPVVGTDTSSSYHSPCAVSQYDSDTSNSYHSPCAASQYDSDTSNSYHSPCAASQYDSEVSTSLITQQSLTTSSYTLGSSLTNPSLSSVNFGLPQDGSSDLFSGSLNLASPHVTSSLVVTSEQPLTVSYATSFPISTSSYSTTNIGMNLPSFNGNFNFSGLGMNFTSSTAMPFPTNVTTYSSAAPLFGLLGSDPNFPTASSTAPSSSFPAGVNLFHVPSSSSTGPLLLGNMTGSVSTTSSASFNLFSDFKLNTSTPVTTENTVSYSTGTSLFATSTSGLSFQVNPSVLQSTPVCLSIASSAVSTSTIDGGLFQHFLKATTTTTTSTAPFTSTTWSLGMSSQLSSDDRAPAGKQDEDYEGETRNESQPTDDSYTPLVKLTDSYEVKSGEEDEKDLFSNRGKLYRYDQPTKAWKEKGVGIIKILQHNVTGKIRVLMRREHILKICCDHYITGEMELTPLVGNNTSWTWITLLDFSDEEAKVERLCIRFKLLEVAQNFQKVFTECVQKITSKQRKSKESNRSGDLSVKFVPKAGSWECDNCYVFNEEHITQCVACGSINPKSTVTSTALLGGSSFTTSSEAVSFTAIDVPATVPTASDVPTSNANTVPPVVTSTLITTTPVLFGASDGGLQSFANLANTAQFQFGCEGNKKDFAGANTTLFQYQKPQKEDSEDNVNPEAEVDVDFKPLVSLPDTYQVTTGQESERQLFCERAKLYRYDPDSKQWKERGIGNMTVMKNPESGKSRLVMHREQVLKLCCNHVILPTMQLNPMLGGGNAWRWFTPCDFSEEVPKAEQLAIRFKKKEQADSFQEVTLRCIQESTNVTTDKDASSAVPAEEQQFSADIKLYQFEMENKVWERKGDGKVIIVKTASGLQIMRVVDTSNCVFFEQNLSSTCKLTRLPSEEKSWSWSYTRSNTSEKTRYVIRFIELSDSNEFEQLVYHHTVTIVPPHSPTSPKIPQLSPSSSCGGSPSRRRRRRRPLIKAVKLVGVWCCSSCNAKNPASEPQCITCGAFKSTPSLLSPTGVQIDNPFFSKGKPVDYSVSSLTSGILSLSNSTAGSKGPHSYTPFTTTLLQHRQVDNESDGSPSLVSVPSQEGSSVASTEQRQPVTRSLFQMPTFTISETKPSFPLLDATGSNNFSLLSSTQPDDKEEEHPETEANIFFDPVVSLLSDFDNKSGEENEECVFTHRAKLYRYDRGLKMWKESGIGNIKILRHKTSNKGRILMRKEQVLKLCCNHYIVPGMTLKPGSYPGYSWVWLTSADYSEEVAQPEILCVKFKYPEAASDFKNTFYTFASCTQSQTIKPTDLSQEPSEDDVVYVGKELPEQEMINLAQKYMLPRTLNNYLKRPLCRGCKGCMECKVVIKPSQSSNILPTVKLPEVKQKKVLLFSSDSETISFADLASKAANSSASGFGGIGFGSTNNKGFPGAGKPLFSTPADKKNETLHNFEPTAEFKPIVKLSSDVTVQSGEENEMVLFSHRAKLYQFDVSSKHWKERGIGDIKILKHKKTSKCRILMRTDRILKLCCNHLIVEGMTMTARDEKSLQWMTLSDFADEEAKAEQFTVTFKSAETANIFQTIFNDCLSNVDNAEGTSLNIQRSVTTASPPQTTSLSKDVISSPLMSLTDSYEVKSGKEDEKDLFSNRGKLYRYDQPTKAWKERGVGIIKILQHNVTGKIRVLMRGEHILKICCNHYITGEMKLTPLVGNNTSWTWTTLSDFSDDKAKVENLCIKFKLFEVAQNFQKVFTKCVQIIDSKQRKSKDSNNSGDLSIKFAPKAGIVLVGGLQNLQSFASLAKTAKFQFGCEKDKKGFPGAGTMLFRSQKPQKEGTVDNVDFKPLVSLPDTYQVTTVQESERQLFCERAKLYRYDPDSKQWKERGIGNITVMKNSRSGKSRLVMRREQVLKLCCNHVILPTMQLNPMLGSENAWRWFTPCDFSEEESKAEQLAIRFKKKEQADSFQEVISRCVQENTNVTIDKDVSSTVPAEERQFSADIKFYQSEMKNKMWETKSNGKEEHQQPNRSRRGSSQ